MRSEYFMRVYGIYWLHWGCQQNRLRRREQGLDMLRKRLRLHLVPHRTTCPWRLHVRLLLVIRSLSGTGWSKDDKYLEWMPIRTSTGGFVYKPLKTAQARLFLTFHSTIAFRLDTRTAYSLEALDLAHS